MDVKSLATAEQQELNALSPMEALTRFMPLEAQVDIADLVPHVETVFGFRVGSFGFLVTSDIYCEITEQLKVNPLPNVESWFSGLLNLRGNLVPVIDLQLLLGETTIPDRKKQQLFAIGQGDKAMAFWIDGLPEIQANILQPLKQLPPLPAILKRCVSVAYLHNGQIWFNVQFDELFKTLGSQYTTEEEESAP
jgi:twitching motility protein PilI